MTAQPVQKSGARVAGSSLVGLALRVASVILGIVVAAVLSRGLGPGGYGLFSVAVGVSGLAALLVDFGFSQMAVREIARRPADSAPIAMANLAVRSGLGLLAGLVLVALAWSGAFGESAPAVIAAAITVPLAGIGSLAILLQTEMRMATLGLIVLVKSAVWTTVVLALAAAHATPVQYVIAMVVVEFGASMWTMSLCLQRHRLWGAPWRPEAGGLVRAGLPLGLMGVGTAVYYKADTLLVYRYAGSTEVGWYAAAYRIMDVAQLLPQVLVLPLVPVVSKAFSAGDLGRARRYGERAVVAALTVSVPYAIAMQFLSVRTVRWLYGPDFASAGALSAALSIAFVGVCLGWVGTALLIATKGVGRWWILTWSCAAGTVAACVWLVPANGAIAAAWVTVGVEFIVGVATSWAALRSLGGTVPLRDVFKLVALVAVIFLSQFAARNLALWIPVVVGGGLAAAVLVALGLIPNEVVPVRFRHRVRTS